MSLRHSVLCVGVLLAGHVTAATAAEPIGAATAAPEPAVEVFTLSTLPVTNARDAKVFYVDSVVLLEQQLSSDLPANPQQAQRIVTDRMAALGRRLQARAGEGATGLARAAQLGVQRAPAIVFDGKYAVYGLTDVDAARRIHATRMSRERR